MGYLDVRKLDDLALALWKDSKTLRYDTFQRLHVRINRPSLRSALSTINRFTLGSRPLTWMELISAEPRYLRYNQNVYKALLGKDELPKKLLLTASYLVSSAGQSGIISLKACSAIASKVVETTLIYHLPAIAGEASGIKK